MAWNTDDILSTGIIILYIGSKDYSIINRDLRMNTDNYSKYLGHKQEVCGLKWSFDGTQLASGGNDNKLMVWNLHSDSPLMKSSLHSAAVKAIAWSPNQSNRLASGGGTADRCIKFWNAQSGSLINSVDTGSQVCALQWSPLEKELLSSHGYAENQLCLWKYPTMVRTKELKGHTSRVLHMATSPDGSLVCSGAADETLRFWNIFASEGKRKSENNAASSGLSQAANLRIR